MPFRSWQYRIGIWNDFNGEIKEIGLIKADVAKTGSTRYARYLPFWA